jgi:hypothetical protein
MNMPDNIQPTRPLRAVLFIALWLGGGLWGLDLLSTHRTLDCSGSGRAAICTVSQARISAAQTIHTLPASQITSASEVKSSSTFGSPGTSHLALYAGKKKIWLSDDDLAGGMSKWRAAEEINGYLQNGSSGELRMAAPMPSAFLVTASVYGVMTALFAAALLFAGRATRQT